MNTRKRAIHTSIVVGCALAGFAAARPGVRTDVAMLLPGDASLVTSHITSDSIVMRLSRVDSTGKETPFGTSSLTEKPMPGRTGLYMALRHGHYPSYAVEDSMVVETRGLIPKTETLILPRATTSFIYDGGHVTATMQKRDSAAVTKELTFPQPVFAFNQMETVVRSLPFAVGYTRVLPLFSEGDVDIEYDTVSVLGKTRTASGADAWRVRFADPVIMMELVVESDTRRLASQTVTYRKSPGKSLSVREWPKAP